MPCSEKDPFVYRDYQNVIICLNSQSFPTDVVMAWLCGFVRRMKESQRLANHSAPKGIESLSTVSSNTNETHMINGTPQDVVLVETNPLLHLRRELQEKELITRTVLTSAKEGILNLLPRSQHH